VGSLPDEDREVFELWWYNERSQPEIAEMLGASLSTIKRRLLSARRQLHTLMGGKLPF
jgi:RNA polymerase sigma-70 factor (ECF subfamily)